MNPLHNLFNMSLDKSNEHARAMLNAKMDHKEKQTQMI